MNGKMILLKNKEWSDIIWLNVTVQIIEYPYKKENEHEDRY